MSLLLRSLGELKNNNKVCEIVADAPEDVIFGQIADYNENISLLKKVRIDNGDFDGYSIIFTGNIRTITWEGELLQQLEILLEDKISAKKKSIDKIQHININTGFFKLIKTINSLFGHISVYDAFEPKDFYFGQVKDIDETHMLMRLMGDKSIMDDSSMIIRLEDIGRIDFGGIYDENMLKLHQIKRRIARAVA
jgi:hypothetical protein